MFKKIEQLRQQLEITIDTMCKKSGIKSKQTYYNYKSGKSFPSLSTLKKMAKVVGKKLIINLEDIEL